jgi:hypothetical protein
MPEPRPVKVMAGCWYWVWSKEETVETLVVSAMVQASSSSYKLYRLPQNAIAIPDNKYSYFNCLSEKWLNGGRSGEEVASPPRKSLNLSQR